tara:strand:- start:403 stop:753 length:351 start_codon:yes stop_codon:yes gene_type:complete
MINQELEYRVLKILEREPNLTQRQIAEKLGISLGKTHYLIKSLVDIGWIKLDNFKRSKNKLGYAYLLTPKGVLQKSSITVKFLFKKKQEYAQLREEIAELQKEVNNLEGTINKQDK